MDITPEEFPYIFRHLVASYSFWQNKSTFEEVSDELTSDPDMKSEFDRLTHLLRLDEHPGDEQKMIKIAHSLPLPATEFEQWSTWSGYFVRTDPSAGELITTTSVDHVADIHMIASGWESQEVALQRAVTAEREERIRRNILEGPVHIMHSAGGTTRSTKRPNIYVQECIRLAGYDDEVFNSLAEQRNETDNGLGIFSALLHGEPDERGTGCVLTLMCDNHNQPSDRYWRLGIELQDLKYRQNADALKKLQIGTTVEYTECDGSVFLEGCEMYAEIKKLMYLYSLILDLEIETGKVRKVTSKRRLVLKTNGGKAVRDTLRAAGWRKPIVETDSIKG